MLTWQAYRDDILFTCRKHKAMAEQAFGQLNAEQFFQKPAAHSNSVAAIVKHLAGNLLSRWTDFLTSDGDKPWRNRDAEFVIGPDDLHDRLLAAWEEGWTALLRSIEHLEEIDWSKKVRIRAEEHTVMQAINRSVAHVAYHVGQIVYLSRMLKTDDWKWITIPPGQSQQHGTGKYLK